MKCLIVNETTRNGQHSSPQFTNVGAPLLMSSSTRNSHGECISHAFDHNASASPSEVAQSSTTTPKHPHNSDLTHHNIGVGAQTAVERGCQGHLACAGPMRARRLRDGPMLHQSPPRNRANSVGSLAATATHRAQREHDAKVKCSRQPPPGQPLDSAHRPSSRACHHRGRGAALR